MPSQEIQGISIFFVERSNENAAKILKVLKLFGFDELGISFDDLINENNVIQLGMPPVRIDILTSITGVEFNDAYNSKVEHQFGSEKTFFLSKENLIKNKKALGRIKGYS